MKPPSWHKGHPKRESNENYHHFFWEKQDYKTGFEKMFRNHVGLVLPFDEEAHRLLHVAIEPPPKPMKEEMQDIMQCIRERDTWEHKDNKFWALDTTMQYFVYRGADQPQHAERASETRLNIARQIGFITHYDTTELQLPRIEAA